MYIFAVVCVCIYMHIHDRREKKDSIRHGQRKGNGKVKRDSEKRKEETETGS